MNIKQQFACLIFSKVVIHTTLWEADASQAIKVFYIYTKKIYFSFHWDKTYYIENVLTPKLYPEYKLISI